MAVVDGATALIMSQNLTKTSFTFNREANIVDRDPADVAALAALFAADWDRAPTPRPIPNLVIANSNARQTFMTPHRWRDEIPLHRERGDAGPGDH